MRFTILQLCCVDCMHFQNAYFTNDDLFKFIDEIITNSDDENCYYIVYFNGEKLIEFTSFDFVNFYYGGL